MSVRVQLTEFAIQAQQAGKLGQVLSRGGAAARPARPPDGEKSPGGERLVGRAGAREQPVACLRWISVPKVVGSDSRSRQPGKMQVIAPEDASDSPTLRETPASGSSLAASPAAVTRPLPELPSTEAELPRHEAVSSEPTPQPMEEVGRSSPTEPQPPLGIEAVSLSLGSVLLQPSPPPSPHAAEPASAADQPEDHENGLVDLPAPCMPRRWVKGANLGSGSFGQVFQGLNCDTGARPRPARPLADRLTRGHF